MREQKKANERREYSAFFSKFLGLSSRIQDKHKTPDGVHEVQERPAALDALSNDTQKSFDIRALNLPSLPIGSRHFN